MTITLATLPTATAQQVFDQVATHLLTQNGKSLLPDLNYGEVCAYRGDGGRKCAAGCLIADNEYSCDWEWRTWERLEDLGHVPTVHMELIEALQKVHDSHEVHAWREQLANVARRFSLDPHILSH